MSINENLIAIDGDGVLVDYHVAYAKLWERVFGEYPHEVVPTAYWALDRYAVRKLDGSELAHFKSFQDEQFWMSFQPMPGALEACYKLKEMGKTLVCVTAIKSDYEKWRLQNLLDLKFPIDDVIATGDYSSTPTSSVKTLILNELMPSHFVDDYLPYFMGVDVRIRRVLIERAKADPRGGNQDVLGLKTIHQRHPDLLTWVQHFEKTEASEKQWLKKHR